MKSVWIPKQFQLTILDDHIETGVCQMFIEGDVCTIYGLNGPKTFNYICSIHDEILSITGTKIIRATCKDFLVDLLRKKSSTGASIKVTRSFEKYNMNFREIEIVKDV